MKSLHTITAIIEGGAGAALLAAPSAVVMLLLGVQLDAPAALALGRVAGAGLFSLGIACWFARNDSSGGAAKGLVAAMLFYNYGVAAVLMYAALVRGLSGVVLWPAVVLHIAMGIWCLFVLLRKSTAKF